MATYKATVLLAHLVFEEVRRFWSRPAASRLAGLGGTEVNEGFGWTA